MGPWILLLLLLLFPQSSPAETSQCQNPALVSVTNSAPEDVAAICQAAGQALQFLLRFDLHPKQPITLEVIEESIDNHGYAAYGSYDSGTDHIRLMSYASILSNSATPEMYDEPFDRVHYAGVIAHEVTHAVMRHYVRDQSYSMAPQEFLAHVTQLAIMPEARREAIIRAMNVVPWEEGDAISHTYMAFSPGRFAVKSYLYLMSLSEPKQFVQVLLNNNWFYVYVPKAG